MSRTSIGLVWFKPTIPCRAPFVLPNGTWFNWVWQITCVESYFAKGHHCGQEAIHTMYSVFPYYIMLEMTDYVLTQATKSLFLFSFIILTPEHLWRIIKQSSLGSERWRWLGISVGFSVHWGVSGCGYSTHQTSSGLPLGTYYSRIWPYQIQYKPCKLVMWWALAISWHKFHT